MSSGYKDIAYQLTTSLFKALNNTVIVNTVTYPCYKGIPTNVGDTYVRIGEVIEGPTGTKDDFQYEGSVSVIVTDESGVNILDKKLAYSIQDKVRTLLKATRTSIHTVTGFTMIAFTPEGSTEISNYTDKGKPRIQLVDTYRYIIE